MDNIQVFEYYSKLGYEVIPIHYKTKTPVFHKWNKNYNYNLMHSYVNQATVPLNFGILLGNIIDIEGDCVESNGQIDDLFKKIDHPIFTSTKSKHHLFRCNIKNLTRIVKDNIEYRCHNHQSVIPPSCHENGTQYEWITNVYDFKDIPQLPGNVEGFLNKLIKNQKKNFFKKEIKPGHTQALCVKCNEKSYIHQERYKKELFIFKEFRQTWSCHKCREIDLRPLIRYHFQR